jgi:hypothetical protein
MDELSFLVKNQNGNSGKVMMVCSAQKKSLSPQAYRSLAKLHQNNVMRWNGIQGSFAWACCVWSWWSVCEILSRSCHLLTTTRSGSRARS